MIVYNSIPHLRIGSFYKLHLPTLATILHIKIDQPFTKHCKDVKHNLRPDMLRALKKDSLTHRIASLLFTQAHFLIWLHFSTFFDDLGSKKQLAATTTVTKSKPANETFQAKRTCFTTSL